MPPQAPATQSAMKHLRLDFFSRPTRGAFAAALCLSALVFVPPSAVEAQNSAKEEKGRTEVTPGKTDKETAPKPDDEANSSEKNTADSAKSGSQFRKAESPSGLQMGLAESEIVGELPQELQEFARKGALASAAKKWKEAKDAFDDMVAAAPENALALANLGMVEFRLEEYQAARDHLRESLSIKPAVAHHWLALALCYYRLENRDLALSCLFRARHEDAADPRVHLYLAVITRDYGWLLAAEKELRRAIALDPQYTDAHYNLALLYLEQSPPAVELARRHYYNALDLGAKSDADIEAALKKLSQ
jgi:Tfp pilus assembly protein PilF